MVVAAMQGADKYISSSLGFSILHFDVQNRGIEPVTFQL